MDFRVVGVTVYPKPHRHRAFNHTSGISVIYLKITKKSYNQQNTKHMSYTEGLELAIKFGMEELYTELVENGATPLQAIMEWN